MMARISFMVLFITLIFNQGAVAEKWYTVKWVNDGDTIVLQDGRRVRYIGINTPEIDHENRKAEPFGYNALELNKKLVKSRKVRLEFDREKRDHYGRYLAYVFLADEAMVNAVMIEHGYAYFLFKKPNLKYAADFLKIQMEAMSNRRGIWKDWHEKQRVYIGNKNSRRFHTSGCPSAVKINWKNRVRFTTQWAAFQKGYAPAKGCFPVLMIPAD